MTDTLQGNKIYITYSFCAVLLSQLSVIVFALFGSFSSKKFAILYSFFGKDFCRSEYAAIKGIFFACFIFDLSIGLIWTALSITLWPNEIKRAALSLELRNLVSSIVITGLCLWANSPGIAHGVLQAAVKSNSYGYKVFYCILIQIFSLEICIGIQLFITKFRQ